jgi:aldehyde dehydrogenase (NAD+)
MSRAIPVPDFADKMFIAGEWRAARDKLPLEDPSNGLALAVIARGGAGDIDNAINAARESSWRALSAVERGRALMRLAAGVRARGEVLAELEARDVGKPLKQAKADVVALERYLEFYGGAADKIGGETLPFQDGFTVLTLREPHGVTGHIIPWNYPMQIIGRSVGAALCMGNAVVLKPAEEACLTALVFAEIVREAGLPAGAVNVVPGLGEEAGAALAGHAGVDHVSFTGSLAVGRLVQKAAADHVRPVTLELGGKSPQIMFADADLARALPFLVNAVIQNAGQTCSAGSRVLIEASIYPQVAQKVAERFSDLICAPALADRDLGPVISARQKALIDGHCARADGDGLALLAHGRIAADAPATGHYVAPRVYGDVPADHPLACEEIFGPVLCLIPFADEAEALAIANNGDGGLVAGVWSADHGRLMRMARGLQVGQVFLNNYGAGGGVELPFGGVGASGHGREKGLEALYSFSRLKTIAHWHG